MNGYTPGLFDRLIADRRQGTRLSLDQLKDAVARDLEDLLNTRAAFPEDMLEGWPECNTSIVTYGLIDIAGLCLSSVDDRARICDSLRAAIERHEPRLRDVVARVELHASAVNRINFVITGVLHAPGVSEPINFDAVLQPSTLHYSIRRNARGSA